MDSRWLLHPFTTIHILALILLSRAFVEGWLPDTKSKLKINNEQGISFLGNFTSNEHFILLYQTEEYITIGGRNTVYNLSLENLEEFKSKRIEWLSTAAHRELCIVKGRTEEECQNYIRIVVQSAPDVLLVCGTNSYKPLCRNYSLVNGTYRKDVQFEGLGICPYNPEHSSTAVYKNGQLYTATVADFSGGDPLIYREPQQTERSDLKQLNAPNFVSSFAYGDYIFFFYRETAVEYINCGKAIYSRVARVCRDDKGGPHQFGNRWTSFLKARLNCSVPGEYPFYFDEIQSMSNIVEHNYADGGAKLIYGTFTTSTNAIGGSAICVFSMNDVLKAFEGDFKEQEKINSNWLPVPAHKVPVLRPGSCVNDSRTLPDVSVNFVKTHSLMDSAVPTYYNHPLLIRVSFQYRFTVISVEPQIRSANHKSYDILYVGTDDGRVLKVVNIVHGKISKGVVISETQIFSNGTPVKGIRVTAETGKIVAVANNIVRLVNLTNCDKAFTCFDCVSLQDPSCVWNIKDRVCEVINYSEHAKKYIQDVVHGDIKKCKPESTPDQKEVEPTHKTQVIQKNDLDNEIYGIVESNHLPESNVKPQVGEVNIQVKDRLVNYTAKTLHVVVIASSIAALAIGFVAGFIFSRRFHQHSQFAETPFIEQHNHLNRLSNNPNSNGGGFLTPRANKAINLVVNVPPPSAPSKKDNLESSKDLNISNEGTLQKIKKTYI